MNIMGFRWFGAHANISAPTTQVLPVSGSRPGAKVVWQTSRQNSQTDAVGNEQDADKAAFPADAAKLDSSTRQQRLWLARDEALGQALKWFGTRFVR